jgi:hypothetical protein
MEFSTDKLRMCATLWKDGEEEDEGEKRRKEKGGEKRE